MDETAGLFVEVPTKSLVVVEKPQVDTRYTDAAYHKHSEFDNLSELVVVPLHRAEESQIAWVLESAMAEKATWASELA